MSLISFLYFFVLTFCNNFSNSLGSFSQLLETVSKISDNSLLECLSHLLWVIPLVLLLNLVGYKSLNAFISIFIRMFVCKAATPLTLNDPTIARCAICTLPWETIASLVTLSCGYPFSISSEQNLLLISSIIWKTLGNTGCRISTGHFSSASAKIVWLV